MPNPYFISFAKRNKNSYTYPILKKEIFVIDPVYAKLCTEHKNLNQKILTGLTKMFVLICHGMALGVFSFH